MFCLIYYYNRMTFSRSPDYTKMFAYGSTWGRRRSSDFSVTIVLGAIPRNMAVGIDEAERDE
jgi:hypothetical protein